ncbi:DUF2185 domain-containing protein [Psychrobium sp. MM17-31]|uniref:DUF2185 domain-containing protein n=1 Tax=Psychrobium sp. MM17-31 TaxID=2917758 RepID=UPI001EF6DF16|nr:DUF2185 domain-containing protein [Psychrobium sp. MM17-31]MCG7532327.1 DUF2185 domain-containing protein [Psychrobium sp. MM17-31]
MKCLISLVLFIKELSTTMDIGYVIVSNEIIQQGKRIVYFYREQPINNDDSGWRFFSGEENQEYVDNPDNFAMYNATSIVDVAPEVAEFLSLPYPAEVERNVFTDALELVY